MKKLKIFHKTSHHKQNQFLRQNPTGIAQVHQQIGPQKERPTHSESQVKVNHIHGDDDDEVDGLTP